MRAPLCSVAAPLLAVIIHLTLMSPREAGAQTPFPSALPPSSYGGGESRRSWWSAVGPAEYCWIQGQYNCTLFQSMGAAETWIASQFRVGGGPAIPLAFLNVSLALQDTPITDIRVFVSPDTNNDGSGNPGNPLPYEGTVSWAGSSLSQRSPPVLVTTLLVTFLPFFTLLSRGYYWVSVRLGPTPLGVPPQSCIVDADGTTRQPDIGYQGTELYFTRTGDTGAWAPNGAACGALSGCTIWYAAYGPNPTPSATMSASSTETATATSSATASSSATATATATPTSTRTNTATGTVTRSSTLSASPSATASASATPSASSSASGSATASMTATATSSLNVTAPDANPSDSSALSTNAVVGISVGAVVGAIVLLGAAVYGVRLAWEGRGPFARGGARHGPKQYKDRSTSARLQRRLSERMGAQAPTGTYAAKHPNMAVQTQLRAMADAYDAVYAFNEEPAPAAAPAAAAVPPPAPVDLGAAEEWGRSGRRLGGAGGAKSAFAPMASARGFVTRENPAAGGGGGQPQQE
jgi:hypothetical protein